MISIKLPDKHFIFFSETIFRHSFHKTAEFEDISPNATREITANRWQIGKMWFSARLLVAIATVFGADI